MNKKVRYIIAIVSVAVVAIGIVVFIRLYDRGPIEQSTLAKVMADIYIVDAMGQNKGNLYSTHNPDLYMENSYHTLLERYGTTKTEFDSAVAWYSAHPEEYSALYDEVVGILTEREARMNIILNKRDSINNRKTTMRDSLKTDLWKHAKTIRLPLMESDTLPRDLVFAHDVDSIKGGRVHLGMGYVFPRRNKATDTASVEVVICYNDTIADTTTVKLERTHTTKNLDMKVAVRDTIGATKVVARLLKSKQLKQTTATLSNIGFYYMPYEITDSVKFDEIQLPPIFAY